MWHGVGKEKQLRQQTAAARGCAAAVQQLRGPALLQSDLKGSQGILSAPSKDWPHIGTQQLRGMEVLQVMLQWDVGSTATSAAAKHHLWQGAATRPARSPKMLNLFAHSPAMSALAQPVGIWQWQSEPT